MNAPNPYLVATSLLFTIPTTLGAYNRQWPLYFSFLLITLTSSLYHATKNKYLLIIDYPACCNLIVSLYFYTKHINHTGYYMISTGSCGILFWGGYFTNHFVFSSEYTEKTASHMIMHIIVVCSGIAASYLVEKHKMLV